MLHQTYPGFIHEIKKIELTNFTPFLPGTCAIARCQIELAHRYFKIRYNRCHFLHLKYGWWKQSF